MITLRSITIILFLSLCVTITQSVAHANLLNPFLPIPDSGRGRADIQEWMDKLMLDPSLRGNGIIAFSTDAVSISGILLGASEDSLYVFSKGAVRSMYKRSIFKLTFIRDNQSNLPAYLFGGMYLGGILLLRIDSRGPGYFAAAYDASTVIFPVLGGLVVGIAANWIFSSPQTEFEFLPNGNWGEQEWQSFREFLQNASNKKKFSLDIVSGIITNHVTSRYPDVNYYHSNSSLNFIRRLALRYHLDSSVSVGIGFVSSAESDNGTYYNGLNYLLLGQYDFIVPKTNGILSVNLTGGLGYGSQKLIDSSDYSSASVKLNTESIVLYGSAGFSLHFNSTFGISFNADYLLGPTHSIALVRNTPDQKSSVSLSNSSFSLGLNYSF